MLCFLGLAETRRLTLVAAARRRQPADLRLPADAGGRRGGRARVRGLRRHLHLRLAAMAVDRGRPAAGPMGSRRRRALSARRGAHHLRPADADAIAGLTYAGAASPWRRAERRR